MPDDQPSLTRETAFNPAYKQLNTAAYVYAYIMISIIIIISFVTVYGMFTGGSLLGVGLGLFSLYLTYLNYRIVSSAIDCDKQMFGQKATFPTF